MVFEDWKEFSLMWARSGQYLNADADADAFRIRMNHRSPLLQHSGMVSHGGVGRG